MYRKRDHLVGRAAGRACTADRDTPEFNACMSFQQSFDVMGVKILAADKDDVFMLTKMDSVGKYEIEKSRVYIGYKLLW